MPSDKINSNKSYRVETLGPHGYGVYELSFDQERLLLRTTNGKPDLWLTPGFIDIHIHGAFGIDFMSASSDELSTLCLKLRDYGYEAFLPATITSSADSVCRALSRLEEHLDKPNPKSEKAEILGFHLEGPFISSNYPGAQPPEMILDPPLSPSSWDKILDHPLLRIVTLAPELPGGLQLISRLAQRGVIASMGHSNATYEEAQQGFEHGARHITHTFNAMRGFHHREAGLTGYALLNSSVVTELIYDRVHVCYEAGKLLLQSKLPENVVAVSDCTMAAGLQPGTDVQMWGHECYVAKDHVCLKSNKALAGSIMTLMDTYRNLADDFGPEVATRLCSWNPRHAIGLNQSPKLWLLFNRQGQCVETFTKPQ